MDKWAPVLKRICWYVVLAPPDSDQVTLLNTTAADKKLGELPEYKELLQTLIVKEVGRHASIAQWPSRTDSAPQLCSGQHLKSCSWILLAQLCEMQSHPHAFRHTYAAKLRVMVLCNESDIANSSKLKPLPDLSATYVRMQTGGLVDLL